MFFGGLDCSLFHLTFDPVGIPWLNVTRSEDDERCCSDKIHSDGDEEHCLPSVNGLLQYLNNIYYRILS